MRTRSTTIHRPPAPPRKKTKKVSPFQYQPLDHSKRQIRLLELSPGNPGSRISARLIHVSLDDNPRYDALSYMWGPPRPTYTISIDEGCSFIVRRNLRKALDDLRQPTECRVIWTDAICINQLDIAEKEFQIQLMRAIYAGAHTVCAWIDHNVQPIGAVFEDLENLGKGVAIGDFLDPSYWYPVADIFRDPYWRRLWVQQELILATKIDMYCRHDVFDGQQLLEFQHRVNVVKYQVVNMQGPERHLSAYITNDPVGQTGPSPDFLSGDILRAKENLILGRETHGEQTDEGTAMKITRRALGSSLLQLFIKTAGLNFTDPRDRVYGVLGLAVDVDESVFSVDYNLSVVGVYTKVFQQFVDKYKSLSFLCYKRDEKSPTSRDNFPTWMPHENLQWGPLNASRACGRVEANHVSIQPDTFVLSAEGLLVDKISFVGEKEDLTAVPIVEFLTRVEKYCERLWTKATERPLYERDDVTSLFYPLLGKHRYKQMWKSEMPTQAERVNLIRSLRAAATMVDEEGLTLRKIIFGGYTPVDVLSSEEREATIPLYTTVGGMVLVGTNGGRLGAMGLECSPKSGDQIWILFGCRVPMVLRPEPGKQGCFTVVGHVVLPGIMRGEALNGLLSSSDATTLRGTRIELK